MSAPTSKPRLENSRFRRGREENQRAALHCRDLRDYGVTHVFFVPAESLGCMGIRVERPALMGPALEKALAARRPVVVDVVTDHRAFSPKTWTGA